MKTFVSVLLCVLALLVPNHALGQQIVADSINFKGASNIFIARKGMGAPADACSGLFQYTQSDDTTSGNPVWVCQNGHMLHLRVGDPGTPSGPDYAINFANLGHTAFQADANFTINPITHTFLSTANTRVTAMESVPRQLYDPWNTAYDGGLAAALAGTSGFSVKQVLQATIDFGECQCLTGAASCNQRIALPTGVTLAIDQVQLWSLQEFSGDSIRSNPTFQHTDNTKPMITGHGSSDTLTCSGHTYTPGGAAGLIIQNIGISGMGPGNSANDIGIMIGGQASLIYNIIGQGNAFGGPAIWDNGFNNFIYRVGYPGSQMSGCASYVSGGVTGSCQTVIAGSTDGEIDYVYATDGAQQHSGHAAGACYPNCAAIGIGGSNVDASHLFPQISDIDIIVNGASTRGTVWRLDGTSREAARFNAGGAVISDIIAISPCTDTALQAAYNAGTPTGCVGINDFGQGNQISGMQVGGGAAGIFGPSFMECGVSSNTGGLSAVGGTYGFLNDKGNPNNTTRNDRAYCGAFSGDQASGRVFLPSMAAMQANNAVADVSGITFLVLATTTPLTGMVGGVAGQEVFITGVPGSSIAVSGNISSCDGLPEPGNSFPYHFKNTGGYRAGSQDNNIWKEICNTPQNNYVHLNWTGNPTPSNPSVVDFYGNSQSRQVPAIAIDVTQLHGPAAPSGHYCFEEEAVYADGSHVVSAQACTTVDLTNMSPGEIFVVPSPQAVAFNLYLAANTTTSGLPLGKYPAPTGSFWGNTVIALGGNGSAVPVASDNTTGTYIAPVGVTINTTVSQPACSVLYQGRFWIVRNATTGDVFQVCQQQSGGGFAWVTH